MKSSRGLSLVELCLALALVAVLSYTVATLFRMQTATISSTSFERTRAALVSNLRTEIGDPNYFLKLSLTQPDNANFLACVCGTAGACSGGTIQPFALYEPGDTAPKGAYKYYDVNGRPCNPTANNCLIQVTTSFFAQCPPALPSSNPVPPSSCTGGAEWVGLFFKIGLNPAVTTNTMAFPTTNGAAYTMIKDVASIAKGLCP